jgi:hypothetical protein
MEKEDLENALNKYRGDMTKVMQSVPFASSESVDRLRDASVSLFTTGRVPKSFKRKFDSSVYVTIPAAKWMLFSSL